MKNVAEPLARAVSFGATLLTGSPPTLATSRVTVARPAAWSMTQLPRSFAFVRSCWTRLRVCG
jgi:hypothetical protein